jgi:hypothetical protein
MSLPAPHIPFAAFTAFVAGGFTGTSCTADGHAASDDEVMEGEEVGVETLAEEARESETIEALSALGYLDTAPTRNPEDRGVTAIAPGAFHGLNLFSSRFRASAVLMDMEGRVLHRWATSDNDLSWMHVQMQPNGDLFVIAKDAYLAKLDWNSHVIWKRKLRVHHDLALGRRGGVFALTRRIHRYSIDGVEVPILDDHIALLARDGRPIRRTALFPLLRFAVPAKRLAYIREQTVNGAPLPEIVGLERPGDITHTNSIQILPRGIRHVAPAGSILLSVREINRIVILDAAARQVLWEWGTGWLQGQHHATLLDNGNILVFDNGVYRKKSRVLELNPVRKRVVWSYSDEDLFTEYRGAAQRLPNGNTLITESDSGHVIEVTRDKKTVWEFWNPDVNDTDAKNPQRAAIYRLRRYPRGYLQRGLR